MFGKSFDMLSSGRAYFAMELLQSGMLPLGLLAPISWMKTAGPNRSTNHKRSEEKKMLAEYLGKDDDVVQAEI